MLPSITKKIHDRSTYEYFKFIFYCDKCGSAWESENYPFSLASDEPITQAEKQARVIMWKAEHDAAYERANTEAIFHFNKCSECNARVCDECYAENNDMCNECNEIKKIKDLELKTIKL